MTLTQRREAARETLTGMKVDFPMTGKGSGACDVSADKVTLQLIPPCVEGDTDAIPIVSGYKVARPGAWPTRCCPIRSPDRVVGRAATAD